MCVWEKIRQILHEGLLDLGNSVFLTFYKFFTMRSKDDNMNDHRKDIFFQISPAFPTTNRKVLGFSFFICFYFINTDNRIIL